MKARQIFILFAATALGGCASPMMEGKNGGATAEVTTDVVKRQDLTGYSFFDGKLMIPEGAKATVHSPYDTPVLSVSTSVGKEVRRGEPIVKLEIPGAEAAEAAAQAYASSVRSDYSAQKQENSQPVVDAKRVLATARAQEKAARDTVASGGEADVEFWTQARRDAEAALADAQAELNRSLQPSKDSLNQAAIVLRAAREDIAKGIVRAPISGTIVSLEAKPGLRAEANQTLATIINYNAVRVQALAPPELKDYVVPGAAAIVALTGVNSNPVDGKIVDVSVAPPSEGQASPGYLTVIKLLNTNAIVQPSVDVKRVGVKTQTVKDALVIPVGAVEVKDGKSMVKVKSGEDWIDTAIETGISDGALIEVKSGLQEGAVVRVVSPRPDGP
ncbi:MAG: hypothetical protein HONBIEJF_00399 [Fimbriimonadaceae bacterium]|nr:hypothetical protein [Fimbriimonadaceae bacterium]